MNWYYTSREKQTKKPFNRSIDNMLAKFFIAFRFDKCINFITVEKLLSASSIINNPEKLNLYVYGIYIKKKKDKRDFHICAEIKAKKW